MAWVEAGAGLSGLQVRCIPLVVIDYLLWYAKDRSRTKFRHLFEVKDVPDGAGERYISLELEDGTVRSITEAEINSPRLLPQRAKLFLGAPLNVRGCIAEGQFLAPPRISLHLRQYVDSRTTKEKS
jgi:hypothetical protein